MLQMDDDLTPEGCLRKGYNLNYWLLLMNKNGKDLEVLEKGYESMVVVSEGLIVNLEEKRSQEVQASEEEKRGQEIQAPEEDIEGQEAQVSETYWVSWRVQLFWFLPANI